MNERDLVDFVGMKDSSEIDESGKDRKMGEMENSACGNDTNWGRYYRLGHFARQWRKGNVKEWKRLGLYTLNTHRWSVRSSHVNTYK